MAIESRETSIAQHPDIVALGQRYQRVTRSTVAQLVEGLTFMGGLYAAMSPWVVGFHGVSPQLAVTNLIAGLGLVALAYGFGTAHERIYGLAWVAPLVGVWLIIAPWVIRNSGYTTGAWISNAAVGGCVVLLGAAMFANVLASRKA